MKIDFVVTWVDGLDPQLLKKKQAALGESFDYKKTIERYRDWDNFQYFFRAIETHANWVNKIFVIVDEQLPPWLDRNHPRIKVVNHKDFIPKKYLPTFSSRTIELNLHRIEELSEQFVLFNDDMLIINDVNEKDFFQQGKPLATIGMQINMKNSKDKVGHAMYRNTQIINDHFDKYNVVKSNLSQWFNFKNLKVSLLNLYLYLFPQKYFPGFYESHLPYSFLKSTFSKVWEKCETELDTTSHHNVRSLTDNNIWLVKYWQICEGNTIDRSKNIGKYVSVTEKNLEYVEQVLNDPKIKLVCLNDNENLLDFNYAKKEVKRQLNLIFPKKSEFEN